MPMWHASTIYFLSDRGPEERFNIWAYDLVSKKSRQVTTFSEFDIHFPSIGPQDIVFEAGGRLYLLDLQTEKYHEVTINVVTDEATIKPTLENSEQFITHHRISPDGKRALVEARGEIYSLPAEHGVVRNLTESSGVAERSPAWSPDGKSVAYWSDRSGEYELTIRDLTKPDGPEKTLTSYGPGFRYNLFWSPDSKMIAFIDNTMTIRIYDVDKGKTSVVDKGMWMTHGVLENFRVTWSSDSRWMAYANDCANGKSAIYLYDVEHESRHQVTSGYYSDASPAFDPDGKYLYFLTNRTFAPVYSDVDNSFVYPNTTNIAAASLRRDIASPVAPQDDEVNVKHDEKKEAKKDSVGTKEKKKEPLKIDLEGFEERVVLLPPKAGNYSLLQAVSGKVVYLQPPNTGSSEKKKPVKYYDLEAREEKTVIDDADAFEISTDGKKVLVVQGKSFGMIDLKPDQKLEKKIVTSDMTMIVDPRAEWRQLFQDAWRMERDYFYDAAMHGINWKKIRDQYAPLIEQAVSRWDVDYILGEMIAELNSSHTYKSGGAMEQAKSVNVGYLGVDWEINGGAYRIARIIHGAPWDVETRSPLSLPGVDVKEGDYVLAVNGTDITTTTDPWSAFQGLGGKTVELLVNSKPSKEGARKIVVEAMADETRLRTLAWIESNRQHVAKASGGRIGYIYVQDTGIEGQNDLVRQFVAQFDKDGLIIDERFNSGGQVPDRFIELLNRKALAYWAVRDGRTWQWPPIANFGPKVMLINGFSGSGGDAFPNYFRKAGLGPLIGTRTWGGLIGISGNPGLIDGGRVTVPTFRMYDPDGKWFAEGHGVDPDIEVVDEPGQLARGVDQQLDRGIQVVLQDLKSRQTGIPAHAPYEKR
jgi:tricorn protease